MGIKCEGMGSGRLFGLVMVAILAAAVSWLPAGQGYVGRTTTTATGNSRIDTTLNPHFTEALSPGEALTSARTNLVGSINADPRYTATSFTDVNDPSAVGYQVLPETGGELEHLSQCENDSNVDNAGVTFPNGKDAAVLNKVAQINANGNFILTVETMRSGTFSQTYNTTLAPNNTAAGLNASITADLTAAGFSVLSSTDNLSFVIRKGNDQIRSLRVSSTDTGVVIFCIDLTTNALLGGIPTVSQWGMLILMILMTGTAVWMMRRRATVQI